MASRRVQGREELPQATPEEVGMSRAALDRIPAVVQSLLDKQQTAGALVLAARYGKVVRMQAFGRMNIAAGTPMRPDAIFRIHSMTKPITTVAAMQLIEQGRLDLDDPAAKYLPELEGLRVFDPASHALVALQRPVTIRDLLRHTSGLTDQTPDGKRVEALERPDINLSDWVREVAKLPLKDQPGTRFDYSISTEVLGRIVEVASGRALDDFLRERIFGPLDMKDTWFFVPEGELSRLAITYRRDKNDELVVDQSTLSVRHHGRPKFLSGGGGLVSTARDYLRFCQMLLNGGQLQGVRVLQPDTVRQMTTNQLPPAALPMTLGGHRLPRYGFGLGLMVQEQGEYGWSGAASTSFWVAPKQKLIVIGLQQVVPFDLSLEMNVKPIVYDAAGK